LAESPSPGQFEHWTAWYRVAWCQVEQTSSRHADLYKPHRQHAPTLRPPVRRPLAVTSSNGKCRQRQQSVYSWTRLNWLEIDNSARF